MVHPSIAHAIWTVSLPTNALDIDEVSNNIDKDQLSQRNVILLVSTVGLYDPFYCIRHAVNAKSERQSSHYTD